MISSQEEIAASHLSRLAQTLAAFDRHIESVKENYDGEPSAGSQAAEEIAEAVEVEATHFGRPILDAYGYGMLRLIAAADHLLVLAQAIKAPPRPFAPQTLARQAVELSARGWHLLDSEITTRQRVERYVNELLHSFWEADLRGITMGNEPAAKRIDDLLTWAEGEGFEIQRPKRGAPWIGKEPRPGATALLTMMLGEIGAVGYRYFSAASHGGISGLVDRLERERPPGEEEDVGARVTVSNKNIAMVCSWALHGFLVGLKRLFAVYGWDDDLTREFRRHSIETARAIGKASGLFDEEPA